MQQILSATNIFDTLSLVYQASQGAQSVKNPPALQEAWVQSLGWEDSLEKEMVTQSSILAWEISQTKELGSLHSMGSQVSDMT